MIFKEMYCRKTESYYNSQEKINEMGERVLMDETGYDGVSNSTV